MKNNHLIQPDTLHRFMIEDSPVRGNLVHLNETFHEALAFQDLPYSLKCALGELMAASSLLAATLKMQGSLILQLQSRGALKLLVVECTSEFKLRATAKWQGEIDPHQQLFDMVKDGQCVITLDPKDGSQTYQGIVPLEGASLAEMLENYMLRSEQIDTKLWLTCDGNSAAGMLIQKLPDATNQMEITAEKTAQNLETWQRINHLADTLTNEELSQLNAQTLLTRLFHEEEVRLYEPVDTSFFCGCSREAVSRMLKMLGVEEMQSILAEQEKIEVHCDFCNKLYQFDAIDAAQLMAETTTEEEAGNKLH
jgi:molecular chaperone Hsp33